MIIGLDFDNTIVSYDSIFYETALHFGVINSDTPQSKTAVRDAVRSRHGDEEWQRLQGAVYGPEIHRAKLIDGVHDFLQMAKKLGHNCCIVSHKTEFANFDKTRTNLRQAALKWLRKKDFFKKDTTLVQQKMVFFASNREEKIAQIKSLKCDVFIDDLPEVLTDNTLPDKVIKILYAPDKQPVPDNIHSCANWSQITDLVFGCGGHSHISNERTNP